MPSHRAAARHRAARRRRVGMFSAALVVTFALGAAAVGVLPMVKSSETPLSGGTSLERASLVSLSQPVTEVLATKSAEAAELRKKAQQAAKAAKSKALPADSGEGRRIVFSELAQRVWLVAADGSVQRTYLVSGSKFDNLEPGAYTVQSKTRHATAFDYSGSMEYFVRFATGFTAPIGFHTVPVDNDGIPEQSQEELGTPQSAGCVRQWRDDAIALWDFAPVGTTVVVTS